ncbi:MAG TPA: glycosyltransferase family 61 protein [Opitutaceae bacterium]|nr:glycosyltransferase family 61 protein [Opitutaceae bacterium]
MNLKRCVKGAEKLVRIGRLRALSGAREVAWLRTRLNLPRNDTFDLRHSRSENVRVTEVDAPIAFDRTLPYMPGELEPHETFLKEKSGEFPASLVVELKRGRFWSYYGGSVFTDGGHLVPELSKDVWGPHLHSAFVRAHLPQPRRLAGVTLSLVTPEATSNYHHWTMDLLPRAGLAQRAGYNLSAFDHVLIKGAKSAFQKEGLARLGIDESRLIRVGDNDLFEAERLVVPSVRHDNTKVNLPDMTFVRRLYLPEEPPPSAAVRRLYIGRRDAAYRRVTNERELLKELAPFGFEEIAMSKMSVAEQAKLFSEAEMIIGPNGSALANLLFANRATRVIEFFAPGWVVGYNWMISANLGHPYSAIIGRGPRPAAGTLPHEIKADLDVDVALVKSTVETMLAR